MGELFLQKSVFFLGFFDFEDEELFNTDLITVGLLVLFHEVQGYLTQIKIVIVRLLLHTSDIEQTAPILDRERTIAVPRQVKAAASVSFLVVIGHHEADTVADNT